MHPFYAFYLLLLFVQSAQLAPFCIAQSKGCYLDSIYSFGDSIADTGNLLLEGARGFFAPIGSFPYGERLKNPTGRCSDGLLMIDYFAMNLNISLINPYLNKNANFDNGVNFAVAGATALNSSFFLGRSILLPASNTPLGTQLEWFQTHLNLICSSQTECVKKLERSLFLIGEIGGNDYNNAFFQGRTFGEVISYVPLVVQSITNATKAVINLGAAQIIVPGNFPIGCIPSYLKMFRTGNPEDYDGKGCLKSYNSFAMHHNEKLQTALEELRQEHPEVSIMYADYYQSFMYLLDHAADLGFEKGSVLKACCGAGGEYNFKLNAMCGLPGTQKCADPSNYISWDGIHLTQEAYKIMAESLTMEGLANQNHRIQDEWKC